MSSGEFVCRSVSKVYGRDTALSDVSFAVRVGEHTAILGPSGCGKSTVLRLLAGLDAPSVGEVWLDGTIVSRANTILTPPHLRGVAMVFQDLALWPNLSVLDNVLLGLSGRRLSKREKRARAYEALALCAIESLADRKPGTLSGGQQQRVALARALTVRPTYLLLDEPFSGLDLVTKTSLLTDIALLVAAQHCTIVLVTHDPLEATTLCRAALVLDEGRVVEAGPFEALLQTPRSETLRVFCSHLGGATLPLRVEPEAGKVRPL
jgi:ABC-type Fe3+/spermidine/putrescine transport system ATPase subunit